MDESQSPLPDAPLSAPHSAAPEAGSSAPTDGGVRVGGAPSETVPVEVAVTRSGGFAGLTRKWQAEPPPAEAPQWIELITRCPWDAAPSVSADGDIGGDTGVDAMGEPEAGPSRGADRFTWGIRARCGEEVQRETELPDDALVGAWRELVDAVRAWSRAAD